jgi:cytohesin
VAVVCLYSGCGVAGRPTNEEIVSFHGSCARGETEEVKRLLTSSPGLVNAVYPASVGKTPLHTVAEAGKSRVAELLLNSGAMVDKADDLGSLPIHTAAEHGHVQVLKVLLKHKADINARHQLFGGTALHVAARKGHGEAVKVLLAKGAKVDDRSGGYTPLYLAASEGHNAVITILLAKGADVNGGSKDSEDTPLHTASVEGHRGTAELLAKRGARKDLASAVVLNDVAFVKKKLEQNPNAGKVRPQNEPYTLLGLAAREGHLEILKLLVKLGADIEARHLYGRTALHLAAREGRSNAISLLITLGADIEAKNTQGETPLHEAAGDNQLAAVKVLLARNAAVNATDSALWTPLHAAIERKSAPEIIDCLLAHGANPEAKNKQDTTPAELAHYSAKSEQYEKILKKWAARPRPIIRPQK